MGPLPFRVPSLLSTTQHRHLPEGSLQRSNVLPGVRSGEPPPHLGMRHSVRGLAVNPDITAWSPFSGGHL